MTIPTSTMAVRVFEHGGPEKLVFGEYPLAEIGDRDVLVRVAAASVSLWDVKYRLGLPPGAQLPGRAFFPLPQQLGREAAGEVVAVGTAVEQFEPGDRVLAVTHPDSPASREAIRGLGNLSRGVDLPGHQALGAYAQYLVRDESMWLPVPDGVELEQAALTLWAFSTAHRILVDRLSVRPADTVVVTGASGGMGQATVQLARLLGLQVIATTRNPAKEPGLRELGADEVVVTDDLERAQARILELTRGEGVEHIVEYSGNHDLTGWLVGILGLGGKICVTTGEQTAGPFPFTGSDFLRVEMTVLGVRGGRRNDARAVLALLEQGRIRTPVVARFPLREAAAAHEFLESSTDRVGRVVLNPWSSSSRQPGTA